MKNGLLYLKYLNEKTIDRAVGPDLESTKNQIEKAEKKSQPFLVILLC